MMRKLMPATLTAATLLLAPLPALAHGAQGADACCEEGGHGDKAGDDCCAEMGDKAKAPGAGDACEDCDDDAHGMKGHGMTGHGMGMKGRGMMGHHAMMGGVSMSHELRYMPAVANATNQWLVLGSGVDKRFSDWFSLGMQHNLAIQTFNTSPNGFWLAPYCGILPKVGYSVGAARADIGVLVGPGAMARTTTVGGVNDVLQARLMYVVEPRAELTWQGDGYGLGLVGTYLYSQYVNDFGGFSVGLKATWGPHGHGMGMMDRKGMMEHHEHGKMDEKKSMDKCEDCEEHAAPTKPQMTPSPAPMAPTKPMAPAPGKKR